MEPYRITVHCTYSPNGKPCLMSKVRELHTASKIRTLDWYGLKIHGFGWSHVGYHFGIQPGGQVEKGIDVQRGGFHVKGHNKGNIGIFLAGTDLYTIAQFETLRGRVSALMLDHDIDPWDVYCHNQFDSAQLQGKQCPGMSINRLAHWLLKGNLRAIEPYLLKAV